MEKNELAKYMGQIVHIETNKAIFNTREDYVGRVVSADGDFITLRPYVLNFEDRDTLC